MGQLPSPTLLRLREADIVRLCGLAAAASGMNLAGRRVLQGARRRGDRLIAVVDSAQPAIETWVEVVESELGPSCRWSCGCGEAAPAGVATDALPACRHVATLLTIWTREPALFAEDDDDTAAPEYAAIVPSARHHATHAARPDLARRAHDDDGPPTALVDLLARVPPRRLRAIARNVLPAAPQVIHDDGALVARLAAALADREHFAALLEGIDAAAVALLRAIVLLGGRVTSGELAGLARRYHGVAGSLTGARQQLLERALLFRAVASGEASAAVPLEADSLDGAALWCVAHEVARGLGPAVPIAPLPMVAPSGPPRLHDATPVTHAGARSWVRQGQVRQLCIAGALLAKVPPPMADSDARMPARLGRAARRGVSGSPLPPVQGDPPMSAIAAWARTTQLPAELLRVAWRLVRAPHGEARAGVLSALNTLPPDERPVALRGAFQRWLRAESFAELAGVGLEEDGALVRCQPRHPALRHSALARENAAGRRFVVRAIAQFTPGAWYAIEHVLDLAWWINPLFLRGRQQLFDQPAWWFASPRDERPLRAEVADEWRRAEGVYLRSLVTGPLHWWGILDLAGTRDGPAQAVRLTGWGAYLLDQSAALPDMGRVLPMHWGPAVFSLRESRLAVQPLAAPPALLDALELWARVVGMAGDRLLWRFSDDLAGQALDAGISPDAMLAHVRAVDQRDGTRVLAEMAPLVASWRARYGRSRIESDVALLEAVDAPTLREALSQVPHVAPRCRLLSPTCALVPADAVEALAQVLNHRGFVI